MDSDSAFTALSSQRPWNRPNMRQPRPVSWARRRGDLQPGNVIRQMGLRPGALADPNQLRYSIARDSLQNIRNSHSSPWCVNCRSHIDRELASQPESVTGDFHNSLRTIHHQGYQAWTRGSHDRALELPAAEAMIALQRSRGRSLHLRTVRDSNAFLNTSMESGNAMRRIPEVPSPSPSPIASPAVVASNAPPPAPAGPPAIQRRNVNVMPPGLF